MDVVERLPALAHDLLGGDAEVEVDVGVHGESQVLDDHQVVTGEILTRTHPGGESTMRTRPIQSRTAGRLVAVLSCVLLTGGAAAGELADDIDAAMSQLVELGRFSGTVLVAKDGDIVYAKAFGEANKDHGVANVLETRFNIGSIGKTITGVAIMQLVESGKVALDAPVASYLEDFPHGDAITIHHLLSHTSGLANYMGHPDYRAKMARIRSVDDALPLIYDQELRFDPPGERFAYSNSGIVLLGAVIEKISGEPYRDYIRTQVLAPAGMHDTGLNYWDEVVEHRAMGYTRHYSGTFSSTIFQVPPALPDGGIETTVLDLLKFDRALLGGTLLSDASKQKMYTPNLEGYAYCWMVEDRGGRRSVGHGGGAPGVSASFRRYLDDGVTIVVLSNYSRGAAEPAEILEAIVFGRDYPQLRPALDEFLYRTLKERGSEASLDGVETLLADAGYRIDSSGPLNFLGYALLGDGEVDLAIAVFELNVSLFPDEANPYDSLAEAYLAAGDRASSIKHYRKALEVDPGFSSARQALERLGATPDDGP